jgi:hypothetical protein
MGIRHVIFLPRKSVNMGRETKIRSNAVKRFIITLKLARYSEIAGRLLYGFLIILTVRGRIS